MGSDSEELDGNLDVTVEDNKLFLPFRSLLERVVLILDCEAELKQRLVKVCQGVHCWNCN